MTELKWLVLIHAASTWLMTGAIWIIQLVHYPLFRLVGERNYSAYEAAHMGAITLLVVPLMLVEAFTGLLLIGAQPPGVSRWLAYAGFALIAVVWLMTLFVNAPQHTLLASGFNAAVHQALVNSNWVRTLAWTGRAVITGAMIIGLIESRS